MAYNNILVETDGPVAVLIINRPKALNALSNDVLADISAALDQLEQESSVRVLIITGAGDKAFVAGADIAELKDCDAEAGFQTSLRGQHVYNRLEDSRLITIAAINGYALGGGCELAISCDIRLASDNARLGQPEVNLGIIPGYGGTQRLPRLVGKGKAMQMILTGDAVKPEDARCWGLVDEVYPLPELLPKAKEMAHRIASKGPLSIIAAKRCIHVGLSTDPRTGMEYEAAQFGLIFGTQDKTEGCAAFLEKRKPEFKGK